MKESASSSLDNKESSQNKRSRTRLVQARALDGGASTKGIVNGVTSKSAKVEVAGDLVS
jgi:hypothetical protein